MFVKNQLEVKPREFWGNEGKKRFEGVSKKLLRAYSFGLLDEYYLSLFSPEVNSTYFLEVGVLPTGESNFICNNYAKNNLKENLMILNSLFGQERKTAGAFRLRNQFGTYHFNIRNKSATMYYFASMNG